jgi:hypothetical protein
MFTQVLWTMAERLENLEISGLILTIWETGGGGKSQVVVFFEISLFVLVYHAHLFRVYSISRLTAIV